MSEKSGNMLNERNFFRFSLYRITSLISLTPVFIIASFALVSGYTEREYLGVITILTMLIGLFFEPMFGYIIDIFERRYVLRFSTFATIILVSLSSILAYIFGTTNPVVLATLLIGGDVLLSLVFSAQRALQQSISRMEKMGRNNGISEITSQLPSMIGSILTVPIIVFVGFFGACLFAILTSIISLALLLRVEEVKTEKTPRSKMRRGSLVHGYAETFRFLRANIKVTLFVVSLNFAFICLMSSNYLTPVYIYELGGGSIDLATVEFLYALFAVISGLVAPRLIGIDHETTFIWIFMGVFALGNMLISAYDSLIFFIVVQPLFFGLGNPSARIMRNTFVMERIPHEISGKFFAGVTLISTALRIGVMVFMTLMINVLSIQLLWRINGGLVLGAVAISIYLLRSQRNSTSKVREFDQLIDKV